MLVIFVFVCIVCYFGLFDLQCIVILFGLVMYFDFIFEVGMNLCDVISILLVCVGLDGGIVCFVNFLVLFFYFFMLVLVVDDQYVVFYSVLQVMEEGMVIEYVCVIVGCKDGEFFVYCYVIWCGCDGQCQGGYLMMEKIVVGVSMFV